MTTRPLEVFADDAVRLPEGELDVPVFAGNAPHPVPVGRARVYVADGQLVAEVTLHEREYELLPLALSTSGRCAEDGRVDIGSLNVRIKSSMREGVEPT